MPAGFSGVGTQCTSAPEVKGNYILHDFTSLTAFHLTSVYNYENNELFDLSPALISSYVTAVPDAFLVWFASGIGAKLYR